MELTLYDFFYLGRFLEGFLYGLYSGIFAIYLHYHVSKNDGFPTKTTVFYALCILYLLSMAVMVLDIADEMIERMSNSDGIVALMIDVSSGLTFGCCDFISQLILIYRCWIVWGCDTRIVIIPLILTITFLALWLSAQGSVIVALDRKTAAAKYVNIDAETGFALSMVVNALVTSLIVFKIIKVFREIKDTSGERKLSTTGGRKLQSTIFMLIESGSALFSIQLARFVVAILMTHLTDGALDKAYTLIVSVHQMLNGITPTIILVRVSMGLSFHDEDSLVEATESLCFAPHHSNSIPEIGSVNEESRDDDIGVQLNNEISSEIQMVDRLKYTSNHIP